jgi:hypothetical protein
MVICRALAGAYSRGGPPLALSVLVLHTSTTSGSERVRLLNNLHACDNGNQTRTSKALS